MKLKWKKKLSKEKKRKKQIKKIKPKIFLTKEFIKLFPEKPALQCDLKNLKEELKEGLKILEKEEI